MNNNKKKLYKIYCMWNWVLSQAMAPFTYQVPNLIKEV